MNGGAVILVPDDGSFLQQAGCVGFLQAASVLAGTDSALPRPIERELWTGLLETVLDRLADRTDWKDSRVRPPVARRATLLHSVADLFFRLDLGAQIPHAVPPFGPTPQGRWLSQVYGAWRQELARYEVGTPGDVWRGWMALGSRARLPETWQQVTFHDFPAWPLALRAALFLAGSLPVTWRMPYHYGSGRWQRPQEESLRMLERAGEALSLEILFDEGADPARAPLLDAVQEGLAPAQRGLFGPASSGDLVLGELAGSREEARWALSRWRQAAAKAEDPEDCVLVLAAPERDALALRQAAAEVGLSCRFPVNEPLSRRPAWRMAERLLSALNDASDMENMAALADLLSPAWLQDVTTEQGHWVSWQGHVQRFRRDGVCRLGEHEPFRRRMDAKLAPWRESAALLDHLERLEQWLIASDADLQDTAELQVLTRFRHRLFQALPGYAQAPTDGVAALSWLRHMADHLHVERPHKHGEVPVLSLSQAAARDRAFVAVIGLDADALTVPRNPLLADEELRKKLAVFTKGDVFDAPDNHVFSPASDWVRLLHRTKYLLLSRPLRVRGEEQTAHPFWERTAEMAQRLGLGRRCHDPTPGRLADWGLCSVRSEEERTRLVDKLRLQNEREAFFACPSGQQREQAATDACGRLFFDFAVEALRKRLSAPVRLSASRLESFAACPFRYYLDYLLGVKPDAEPGVLMPMALGSALHKAAERYVRAVQKHGWPLRPEGERLGLLRDVVRSALEEVTAFDGLLRREWGFHAAVWSRRLELLFSLETPPSPRWCEAHFGLSGETPLLSELPLSRDGRVVATLSGILDRLDYAPKQSEECRLVDYKTGKNASTYKDRLKEESFGVRWFQAPLYLLAVRQSFERFTERPVTYTFRFALIGNPDAPVEKTWGVNSSYFEELTMLDEERRAAALREGAYPFADRVADIAERMIAGRFDITPTDCGYCSFRAICRYEESAVLAGASTAETPDEAGESA